MSEILGLFVAGAIVVIFGLAIIAEVILERFYGE